MARVRCHRWGAVCEFLRGCFLAVCAQCSVAVVATVAQDTVWFLFLEQAEVNPRLRYIRLLKVLRLVKVLRVLTYVWNMLLRHTPARHVRFVGQFDQVQPICLTVQACAVDPVLCADDPLVCRSAPTLALWPRSLTSPLGTTRFGCTFHFIGLVEVAREPESVWVRSL